LQHVQEPERLPWGYTLLGSLSQLIFAFGGSELCVRAEVHPGGGWHFRSKTRHFTLNRLYCDRLCAW